MNDLVVYFSVKDMFSQPLARMEGQAQRFMSGMTRSFRALSSLPGLVGGFALFKIGEGFIEAADKVEVWQKQLESVSRSTAEANQSLAAIREFARVTPLETEDVIRAYVKLRAVGIEPTTAAMRTLGGVGLLFGKERGQQMQQIADAFIGMNKKTLRQLGIEIDRTGQTAIITSGKIRVETSKDAASIREGLLKVWGERFPDAMAKASETFGSKMAIIRSNVFELQAQIGQMFIGMLGGGADQLNAVFDGIFANMGKVRAGIMVVVAVVRTFWNVFEIVTGAVAAAITGLIFIGQGLWKSFTTGVFAVVDALVLFSDAIYSVNRASHGDFTEFANVKARFFALKDFIGTSVKEIGQDFETAYRVQTQFGGRAAKDAADIAKAVAGAKTAIDEINKPVIKIGGELPTKKNFFGGGAEDEGTDAEKRAKERLRADKEYSDAHIKLIQHQADIEWQIIEEADQKRRESIQAQRDLAMGLGAAMTEGLGRGMQGFKDSAKAMMVMVIDMLEKRAQSLIIIQSLFDWSALGKLFLVTAAFETVKKGIQSLASGTTYAQGGMAFLHKNETVYLPRGSQVIPAGQGRGAGNTFHLNFNGPVDKSTLPVIQNQLAEFGRTYKRALRAGYVPQPAGA